MTNEQDRINFNRVIVGNRNKNLNNKLKMKAEELNYYKIKNIFEVYLLMKYIRDRVKEEYVI